MKPNSKREPGTRKMRIGCSPEMHRLARETKNWYGDYSAMEDENRPQRVSSKIAEQVNGTIYKLSARVTSKTKSLTA